MIELDYEMTYTQTIDGPLGKTTDSALGERVCWQITSATLKGPRVDATATMPGVDWMRLGSDGFRRQDQRVQLSTDDGELILLRYDIALVQASDAYLAALAAGVATAFEDQYIRMVPQFEAPGGRYEWLTQSLFLGRGRLSGRRQITYEIYRVC
jgi:Protein of unknown function (DUF3237)